IGGQRAPLLTVAPNLINAQVPFGLGGSSVNVVVENENGSSIPVRVNLVAQDPGIFTVIGGHDPPLPGDVLNIRATGLGSVSPPVADGVAAPSSPPTNTVLAPIVRIGGQVITPSSSTLVPGMVGVYSVIVTVPGNVLGSAVVSLEAQSAGGLLGPPGPVGP